MKDQQQQASKFNDKNLNIVYSKAKCDADHWAINYKKAGTSIAEAIVNNKHAYSIILNPTDCRCYRIVIRYLYDTHSKDIHSSINRAFTIEEEKGLKEVTSIMEQIFKKIGLIPQFALLGNNSHSFNEQTKQICIGSEEEPGFLHIHIWGRGVPSRQYIPGVKLKGQPLGCILNIVAKGNHEGKSQNIKWNTQELKQTLSRFKVELRKYITSQEYKSNFQNNVKVVLDQ